MEKWLTQILDHLPTSIRDDHFTLYAVLLALLVLIATFVILKLINRSSKSGRKILITGLSDSGKTLLFSRLIGLRYVVTTTSMKQNELMLNLEKKSVCLVDIPGYERIRAKFWEDSKNGLLALIFVIDSYQFMSNIRDVADYFYTILIDPTVRNGKIPILVACNKQDKAKSKSCKIIKNQLEKEINTLRETRRASLDSISEENNQASFFLGLSDKEFSFNDVKNPIEFINLTASAKTDNDNLNEEIYKWLNKVA